MITLHRRVLFQRWKTNGGVLECLGKTFQCHHESWGEILMKVKNLKLYKAMKYHPMIIQLKQLQSRSFMWVHKIAFLLWVLYTVSLSLYIEFSLARTFFISNFLYIELSLYRTFYISNFLYLELSLYWTFFVLNFLFLELSLYRTFFVSNFLYLELSFLCFYGHQCRIWTQPPKFKSHKRNLWD